jgi:uncharacterized membrane protein (UPF0127 family)
MKIPSVVKLGNVPVNVEIAKTYSQHAKGLMNREELFSDSGMLFVFDEPKPQSFWMANTLIPLDIIWIDSHKKVVGVAKSAQPCREKNILQCETFSSNTPVKYVLEVNAGWFDANGLKIGDTLDY